MCREKPETRNQKPETLKLSTVLPAISVVLVLPVLSLAATPYDTVCDQSLPGKLVARQCLPYAIELARALYQRHRLPSELIFLRWHRPGGKSIRHVCVGYQTGPPSSRKQWLADNEHRQPIPASGSTPEEWLRSLGPGRIEFIRSITLPQMSPEDEAFLRARWNLYLLTREATEKDEAASSKR
jgi:hypothetical protein